MKKYDQEYLCRERQLLVQEFKKTMSQTGLTKEELKKLLRNYGHTEIRAGGWVNEGKRIYKPVEIWKYKSI